MLPPSSIGPSHRNGKEKCSFAFFNQPVSHSDFLSLQRAPASLSLTDDPKSLSDKQFADAGWLIPLQFYGPPFDCPSAAAR